MTNTEFYKLSTFIFDNFGIKLPIAKKTMLEGRLQKRLRALKLSSFKEYCDYVFSARGQEMEVVHMIDVVATNKTDFFREAAHFEFLSNNVLPKYIGQSLSAKPFKAWSAGCSTGEEPYTLAMVLSEFSEKSTGFDFNIFATDISTKALSAAATAVYTHEKAAPVPFTLKKKYLLKSRDEEKKTVRIVPELRKKVNFRRVNFLDNGDVTHAHKFNVIFCRNVLIYFDRPTQEKVILNLCSKLEHGGYLFLGHSESISNMNLPLVQIQPTTFKKYNLQQPPGDTYTDKYYLYPGKTFSSKKPHVVGTLLGSCVAVFLWDSALLFGSVNHYMLPFWNKEHAPSCKYGDIAISHIITQMLKFGSCKKNLKAKIFGGSEITNAHGTFNIGERNIRVAQDTLGGEQIPIINCSVGGSLGRKAMFYTASGDVLISYIKNDVAAIDQQSNNSIFNPSQR